MKIRNLILFFTFLTSTYTHAQVADPPDLNCVSVDNNGDCVLSWSLPVVTCGAFNGYLIYRSLLVNGPYTLIYTELNPLATTYTDGVGNGGLLTYYYYMVSDFNCPGYSFPTSDTVDNLDPLPPVINYVTVNNGLAEIDWTPSTSPETYGYIIYQEPGNVPIDTVYGNVSHYIHLGSTPNSDSMSYTLATIDSCLNTGLINEKPQHTIYLQDTIVRCAHSVYLQWYAYNNWKNGVKGYDIYLAKNGGASLLYKSLPGNKLTDTISDLNDGDMACISIVATENITGTTSVSNEVCFTLNVVQPAKDFFIRNVTVVGNDSIEIYFSLNELADITNILIQRGLDSINFSLLKTIPPPTDLSVINKYLDKTPLTTELSYYYRMIATDSCGNKDTSTIGKSILLKGYAFSNLTFYNNWDVSVLGFGNVLQYDIYRNDDGNYNYILSKPDDVFIYEEKNIPTNTPCYYVESKVAMDFPNGIQENIFSRSNKVCLNQPSQIYVANAFAPRGQNNIFKPILNVDEVNNYTFYIFNRWGEQLFFTTDPSKGWDGKYKGSYVQQGGYGYNVSLTDGFGRVIFSKGTVLLMR